jgi:hypothetical protein
MFPDSLGSLGTMFDGRILEFYEVGSTGWFSFIKGKSLEGNLSEMAT